MRRGHRLTGDQFRTDRQMIDRVLGAVETLGSLGQHQQSGVIVPARHRSRAVTGLPMSTHMTTDVQTQAIPRLPTTAVAVPDPEAADSDPMAPDSDSEHAETESVQKMYEAALTKLAALHDRWAAAMTEIREAQTSGEPEAAAA
jgi:hypothetical protein